MFTFRSQEIGLPDPQEVAEKLGKGDKAAYWGVNDDLEVILILYPQPLGSGEVERIKVEEAKGVYGVSVPGTVLCPWDADFCRTYFTRNKRLARALAEAVRVHFLGASMALAILNVGRDDEV